MPHRQGYPLLGVHGVPHREGYFLARLCLLNLAAGTQWNEMPKQCAKLKVTPGASVLQPNMLSSKPSAKH